MIKRLFILSFLGLALTLAAQAQNKIAVVDLKHCFEEYYKTKDAEDYLKSKAALYQKEIQSDKDDYQKMLDEANKLKEATLDKTLSDSARQDKKNALQVKAQDIMNQERKIQEEGAERQRQFEDQQSRMRQGIADEIVKVVNDIGARERYSLIFDKSGTSFNGAPVLLYSQDVKDITEDVIKTINATKPAGSAPAATPGTATPSP